MARLPRLLVPGLPAHVWIRGNNRQAIFRSEGDRIFFHRCLVEVSQRLGLAVHAYVFMTNHVHLLATGERADSLPKAVQSMGRRYVSYFNYLHERTGTLWEGRYKSCPVESDRYFLVCHQYVESNPVRAGMVRDPGEHKWSSHCCNARGAKDDLVTPHSLYMELGSTESARLAAYRALFRTDMDDATLAAIRDSASRGWALGGKHFCDALEERLGRPAARRAPGRPRRADRQESRRETPEFS